MAEYICNTQAIGDHNFFFGNCFLKNKIIQKSLRYGEIHEGKQLVLAGIYQIHEGTQHIFAFVSFIFVPTGSGRT